LTIVVSLSKNGHLIIHILHVSQSVAFLAVGLSLDPAPAGLAAPHSLPM